MAEHLHFQAHAYLEQHAVLLWVQEVLRELVKEQPGQLIRQPLKVC